MNQDGTSSMTSSEKADLISELTEVKANLDKSIKQYEHSFGETFHSGGGGSTDTGGMGNSNLYGSSLRKTPVN